MTWIDVLQGLSTPAIGVAIIYIAYRQYRTDKDKLRYDLYQRRLKVYQGTSALLAHISVAPKTDFASWEQFVRETAEAAFLFGNDVKDYLEAIRDKSLDLWVKSHELKCLPEGKERSKAVTKITELRKWFADQRDVMQDKFEEYLRFGVK